MSTVAPAGGARAGFLALSPSPAAAELARHMVEATAVHRAILEETIASIERGDPKEAGRTACGTVNTLRAPIRRFPRAVELAECPVTDAVGIWHTHPGRGELANPRHSLPDWGNVVFGWADASVVTGTESAQVLVAGADGAAMQSAFQEAVGVPIVSKRGIMAAVLSGEIPDYLTALDHVEHDLRALVRREPVHFPALDARLDEGTVTPGGVRATAHGHGHEPAGLCCHELEAAVSPDVADLRHDAREAAEFFRMAGARAVKMGFEEAIGIVAGTVVSNWLFE